MNRNTDQKIDDVDPIPQMDFSWVQFDDCLNKNLFQCPGVGNPFYQEDCQKNKTFLDDFLLTYNKSDLSLKCHSDLEILFKIYPMGLNDPYLKMPKSCSEFI